jgi:hypothetical protein
MEVARIRSGPSIAAYVPNQPVALCRLFSRSKQQALLTETRDPFSVAIKFALCLIAHSWVSLIDVKYI